MGRRKPKQKKYPRCCSCLFDIREEEFKICQCHYHKRCLKGVIKQMISHAPGDVKIESFENGEYSIECPKCETTLLFKTQLIKRKCEWCHNKCYYEEIKPIFIFSILAFFFWSVLLCFLVYVFWAHEYVFQLDDWKKYLLIAVFLLIIMLALIRLFINIYYTLGMWIENKVILLKEKTKETAPKEKRKKEENSNHQKRKHSSKSNKKIY